MYIVGLTGGIGSGKSTAAAFFRKHVDVVDADEVARSVVRPGSPALTAIAAHFGKVVIAQDGTLNRSWLRNKIFSDPVEKKWLEALLHPLIRTNIVSALQKSQSPYSILMSPLLLETDQCLLINRVLVIDTSEEIKIARVVKRDNASIEDVKAIIHTQLPRQERLTKADDIVINTTDVHLLEQAIIHLHQLYITLASL